MDHARLIRISVLLVVLICVHLRLSAAIGAGADYFPPPESQAGWRVLDDDDDIRRLAGMDPQKLEELEGWLRQSDQRDFAAVVIRNGYIVLEVERGNSSVTDTGNIKSCAKAICATVLAIASERSQRGLTPRRMTFDDRAFEFIPWAQPLSDPRKSDITVRQLLNHTSGITPESTGIKNRGPWSVILGQKLAFDPGTDLDYGTQSFYHASLVCENVTGQNYEAFATEHLLQPLGISGGGDRAWFEWFEGGDDRIGRHPSHAMGLPARDMARIAYCMLRDGRWSERQVVPRWFVEQTAKPTHDVEGIKTFDREAQSFSHGWELPGLLGGERGRGIPKDARFKPGSGGQLIAFVPSLDLVVVRQTGGSGKWEYEEYLRRACAAVIESKQEDAKPQAPAPGVAWPGEEWDRIAPEEAGMDAAMLERAKEYALTSGGSGMIIRGGRQVMAWGDTTQRFDLKSSTKSFGATALGVALLDGKVKLHDRAAQLHPTFGTPPDTNRDTGWLDEVTLYHLATQTAGFEKPGGYGKLMFKPGTAWHYSDAGPNWLAECLTLAYGQDMREMMFERVFEPLGISRDDLTWRNNSYRPDEIDGIPRREFGSGIHANTDAMARFGLLYLRGGQWRGQRLLSTDFVAMARKPIPEIAKLPEHEDPNHPGASDHYGLLWWNNGDGTLKNVPRDAHWTWGLYDSLVVVIPSLDLVVARAGPKPGWKRVEGAGHYEVLAPFLEPIVAACSAKEEDAKPQAVAIDRSAVIAEMQWADAATIRRVARGGDNWPMTWADDDAQYTAYGDGRGFEPFVPKKLSMGMAKVLGPPEDFKGINLPSETIDTLGDGPRGKKASGLVCLDGTLYLWARNAGNSQLAWSSDHGGSWQWADWKFTESFGCPAFLQFGRDGAGSRDEYVYIYSFDSDSAYVPADRHVLARVHKDKLRQREAYEFFAGLDDAGKPRWSSDVKQRRGVVELPGRCYRLHVTYHPGLKRYLLVQPLPKVGEKPDLRFGGGLMVLDAPEPWGPWTAAYWSEQWDVGPGESANFPSKWIGADGKTLHMVFSGDDYFSVRQAKLVLHRE